jgi:RNA polymerase sigma factor (sigma-70 family)
MSSQAIRRQINRRHRRHVVVDISSQLDLPGAGDVADEVALVDLKRALVKLSPDDRMLLALRFVARLDSTEIANQLGLSASGARSRLARLLDRLRVELEPPEVK